MRVRCEICGKGPQFGHNVSHSKRATKRRWLPNIQRVTIRTGQTTQRLHICIHCLRTLHKV